MNALKRWHLVGWISLGAWLLGFLLIGGEGAQAGTVSIWNTTYGKMYLTTETDGTVTGYYHYDGGVVVGTRNGRALKGWWKEVGNSKECGPGNEWSGPISFLFSKNGSSFTGAWGYCPLMPEDLDPKDASWTGKVVKAPKTVDLIVKWTSLAVLNGVGIEGQIHVANIGQKPTGQFIVAIYLSPDGETLPATPFKTITVKSLKAGTSKVLAIEHTFDESVAGQYVVAVADSKKKIAESDEKNNSATLQIIE